MSKARKAPRIDVMLSSTTRDLPEHREKATRAILRAEMHPVAMEHLTASVHPPLEVSLKLVEAAEVYVGVFGMRYGYVPNHPLNPDKRSITELEFRHAVALGKVILIFMMDKDHPGPKAGDEAAFFEQETDGKTKLKALKEELGRDYTVAFFTSPEDLQAHIIQALRDDDLLERARALAAAAEKAADSATTETPLPAPPALYANPPYTLTDTFVGRSSELRQLDEWASNPAQPLMIVEAIGGMGKSAVTWHWLQERALPGGAFDGVLWWSFYESGATMAAFLRHALAYLTRQDPAALKGGDPREHFKALLLELNKHRYLLVLDGLERILVAYHRWNAAQMRDDTVEKAESIIKDRDIRACTDPRDDEILRGLLACKPSKVLVSSRLLPLALEERTGALRAGAKHIHLNGLSDADALALVRAAGVTVHDERQFSSFVDEFGGHSLLVTLVAGRVNKFRRPRGDFDAWYNAEGRLLTVKDFDLRGRQAHILEYALAGLTAEAMRFLSQVAAFGDAVPYKVLEIFNPFARPAPEPPRTPNPWFTFFGGEMYESNWEDPSYLQAKADHDAYLKSLAYRQALTQFDALLTELEERGVLRWERATDRYDMHPVVRGTASDRLEESQRQPTFARVRGHFESQPEDIQAAQEVGDLSNSIGIYRMLLAEGLRDEAARFFDNRLRGRLWMNIAAYYTVLELLLPLFSEGTDRLPPLHDPDLQGNITTTLALMFYYIGRGDEARALQELLIQVTLERGDSSNLIIHLQNYANSLRAANRLRHSERVREAALALAKATGNDAEIIDSTLFLLASYRDTGQWAAAEAAYAALGARPPRDAFWQAAVERYYAETLIARGLPAEDALARAEMLATQGNNALSARQIKRLRGEVGLRAGDAAAAQQYFAEAVAMARRHGSAETATYLGCLARACAMQRDEQKALEYIEEALLLPMKEEIHDLYASIAEVYLLLSERAQAAEYGRKAYAAAWADGSPYAWWWALERAKAVLDALGEPYPAMPPFDEARIGKYFMQDEVEAYIERIR
jgi:hypothetical protein